MRSYIRERQGRVRILNDHGFPTGEWMDEEVIQ